MPRSKEIPDEDILVEFYLHDDPALFAKEVAETLGMTRQGVHDRLSELSEDDFLNSKKPGRDRVYWLTEEGRERAKEALRD